tara:strand:+ start:52291 stop:52674 length:384 start_codon:yes stop_codon:yes gene_type:complete
MENHNNTKATIQQPNGTHWMLAHKFRKDYLDCEIMKIMNKLSSMKTQSAGSAFSKKPKSTNPKITRQQIVTVLDYEGVFVGGQQDGIKISESLKRLVESEQLVRFDRAGKMSVAIPSATGEYASYYS